jgi:thiol reductant ABC exporter CydC subunit
MSTVATGSISAVRRALRLATPDERRRLALASALGALASLAGTALLGLSGYLISRAAEHPPVLSLTVAIVCVRGFGIARAAARYGERLVGHDAVLGTLARLRASTFSALIPRVPGTAGGRSSAELLDGVVADVDRVQDAFLRSVAPLVAGLAVGIAGIVWAALVLPAAGLVVLVLVLALGVLVPWVAQSVGRRTTAALPAARARLVRDLATTLDAAPELVMSGAADQHAAAVARRGDELTALDLRDATGTALTTAVTSAVGGLAVVAVLAVALAARADGALAPTMVGMLALLVLGLGEALGTVPQAARELHGSADAVLRVEDLGRPDGPAAAGAALPADGAVRLRDVAVRRGGRTILEGFDLDVAPGERVALVGPSGAGKSTIAELLVGFVDAREWTGEARIGGRDLRELDGEALRRTVLHLPQEPYLFDASLRANLLLARPDASDDELLAALTAVGADPWLAGLQDGLDAPLGERGARCSGGERQRIGLARGVLARGHALVLLDEPTSNLPVDGAVAALAAVVEAVPGRGALIVAHRPEEAALAHRVVALEPARPPRAGIPAG